MPLVEQLCPESVAAALRCTPVGPGADAPFSLKHSQQQASILGHMAAAGLLPPATACAAAAVRRAVYIELGAGRGYLMHLLAAAYAQPGADPGALPGALPLTELGGLLPERVEGAVEATAGEAALHLVLVDRVACRFRARCQPPRSTRKRMALQPPRPETGRMGSELAWRARCVLRRLSARCAARGRSL